MSSLRILIVDDQQAVRKGIISLLSRRSDWSICGEADDGLKAIERANALRPDVVLMDISMPRMNGLDATRIIRRELPESKVVIVTQNDPAIARQLALEVKADGCVSKSDLSRELLSTIEGVLQGQGSPTHGDALLSIGSDRRHKEKEDDRQQPVLMAMAQWLP